MSARVLADTPPPFLKALIWIRITRHDTRPALSVGLTKLASESGLGYGGRREWALGPGPTLALGSLTFLLSARCFKLRGRKTQPAATASAPGLGEPAAGSSLTEADTPVH
jgi:hypothetical protein